VRDLNAVVFVRQLVDRISKAATSVTSSVAAIRKISSQISLAAAVVVVHAKVKIYRLNQRFHFANLYLAQR